MDAAEQNGFADHGSLQSILEILASNEQLHDPKSIPAIVEFWLALPGTDQPNGLPATLSAAILSALLRLAEESTFYLAAIHSSGLISRLLPQLFESKLPPTELAIANHLCQKLLTLGVANLEDAQYIFRSATTSAFAAEFLLQALKNPRGPAHIQFDLSLHGHSSVELSSLGRSFPPVSGGGYTFAAWIRIDTFDPSSHTTIFGAFDASQTCFVLAYLEKDTQNFILQTSVVSSKPSIRFKSTKFLPNRWYHICLVHRRPKTISSSKAALFVDGEFVEQLKCQYPFRPPHIHKSQEGYSSLSTTSGLLQPVQIFLGTPQNLSSRLGKGILLSRWSLALAHLFEEVLSDDLIAVYYRLGPQYNGNFQDCLGSFQTYDASAALNVRNETLHPGRESKSDIVLAIRDKASVLLPENRILLNISPTAVLDSNDRNNIDESQLIKSLSKRAGKNLKHLTRPGGNAVAINGAIPSINEALTHSHGMALLVGEPIVIVPQTLDDACWRVGGCAAVTLKLIEVAKTRESVIRAVEILFEIVKENWRNSEAMERENGYGILGILLRAKMGGGSTVTSNVLPSSLALDIETEEREKLGFELLDAILKFVGYKNAKPEDSILVNPLAYRVLLVDLDLWRRAAPATQELYYKQFSVFGLESKYHRFNSKRLFRMRIVKRLIDALKGETFSSEVFPHFILAFKSLVKCNMSSEILRCLALFVTYSLQKAAPPPLHPLRSKKSSLHVRDRSAHSPSRRPFGASSHSRAEVNSGKPSMNLTKVQVGIKVLEMYTEILCERDSTVNIIKFAKTVTNKWLLFLLAEEEALAVVYGMKILARLLIVHGSAYINKFSTKTSGFIIMKHRLKRWWSIPALWPICFAIMFGKDVADINFERKFELYSLMETFASDGSTKVANREMFPVMACMIQTGLKTVVSFQTDPDSPSKEPRGEEPSTEALKHPNLHAKASRRRSMSLNSELSFTRNKAPSGQTLEEYAELLSTVARFLADIHAKSQNFRDYAVTSNFIQELLFVLFPVIVSSDTVSPETELNSRDAALNFEGIDVVIRPLSRIANQAVPIVRTTTVEAPPSPTSKRVRPLRRGSSFVLISSIHREIVATSARSADATSLTLSPKTTPNMSNQVVQGLLEIVVAVFLDQVLERKDFQGFNLPLRVPPGFQEHQAYFESFLLRNALSQLENTIKLNQKLLWEPKVLTNLARFIVYLSEAVFEGWFLSGAAPLLEFVGATLEYLQLPDVARIKNIRICYQAVATIKSVFLRVILLRLSELDEESTTENESVVFLDKLMYWHHIIINSELHDNNYLQLVCYLLYSKLINRRGNVRLAVLNIWRILLVQKPIETSTILNHATSPEQQDLATEFMNLAGLDNEPFLNWIDWHCHELNDNIVGSMSKPWEEFVAEESRRILDSTKQRNAKRREKLKHWITEDLTNNETFSRHDVSAIHWVANIYSSELLKYQRAMQDQQDTYNFIASIFIRLDRDLRRPCGLLDDGTLQKWQLDQTEGRNRMRRRTIPDHSGHEHAYGPKRKQSENNTVRKLKLDAQISSISAQETPSVTPMVASRLELGKTPSHTPNNSISLPITEELGENEEDFEIVDNPSGDAEDGYEDKNRKVMRSLQRGDQVQHVYNVSRIVGLEACEGLLILGKDSLYLLDNLFQRSDGEIVNVRHAPREERDPYLQMISGRETNERRSRLGYGEFESRNWKWEGLISISKRHFLFRDVAIEIFFTDGRSYLLTANTPDLRNGLYLKLFGKAPHVNGTSSASHHEELWRLDSLKSNDVIPQSLTSKFANVFSLASSDPTTRKWIKGEISNFHYLMLVNTMAGRTFNDLTQYPVFPWVIADYTSEELDLTNPRTFRDLSKPMGCQTGQREADFRDRYTSFAEMGDHNAPPFHYGTHYSSAMIVSSYLIRLQPFVQSYLLLQGGNFDHADRLFYSIHKAWISASQDNMTDVRELIPEFFYLPEFLTNSNEYDFGTRQGNGERINSVKLPPWAKGDPNIFICKHRQALESPHVSRHLHQWIDLIFGHKQRGEAARESTNVFHHLSYHGAKDLDTIEDPMERLATIGIIHNFGQTPHQIFQKPHPPREEISHRNRRLDTAAETLTRLPFMLLESHERVSSLIFAPKQERVLCSAAFRLNIPPIYEKYMEWGFSDGSVRFYSADTRKLVCLFENLHNGQLSCGLFVDSRTLITAGTDCTISVWTVNLSTKSPDILPKVNLFGHKKPVRLLAFSRSFSAFLSVSTDGEAILWDLNRLEFVRKLASGEPAECAQINDVTGTLMLCRGRHVTLYTLNGDLLLDQQVCDDNGDCVMSCAFYEGLGNEWLERDILFTGHRRGVVKIWSQIIREGKFTLKLVKRLNHSDQDLTGGINVSAGISCILAMPHVVYTGDEDGRVYEWDCVQRKEQSLSRR
ncbi:MAG: hypothetical protein M1829_000206 [Trizodia sp. TS-e1964]|nr:MAG: hypothetical protein M1829_000206 [Trizodia sp. TS-e1964]